MQVVEQPTRTQIRRESNGRRAHHANRRCMAGEGCDQDRPDGSRENDGSGPRLHRRISRRESGWQTVGSSAERAVFGLLRCCGDHAEAITVRQSDRPLTCTSARRGVGRQGVQPSAFGRRTQALNAVAPKIYTYATGSSQWVSVGTYDFPIGDHRHKPCALSLHRTHAFGNASDERIEAMRFAVSPRHAAYRGFCGIVSSRFAFRLA
jgi:hypothetical protein